MSNCDCSKSYSISLFFEMDGILSVIFAPNATEIEWYYLKAITEYNIVQRRSLNFLPFKKRLFKNLGFPQQNKNNLI